MSFPAEDGVGSLCHKALQIISELCLGGQVEREKCAGIFPLEGARQGIGGAGTDPRPPPPGSSCRRRGADSEAWAAGERNFFLCFPCVRRGRRGGPGTQPALKSAPSRSPPRLPRSAERSAGTARAGTSAAGKRGAAGEGAGVGTGEHGQVPRGQKSPPAGAPPPETAPYPRSSLVRHPQLRSGKVFPTTGVSLYGKLGPGLLLHVFAGGERGRGLRSMLLSRVGSGSVLRARLSCPRPSLCVWRVALGARATGWAAGSAGSRHGSGRSRGSGRSSPSPGSQSPLSEWGLSILRPLRSSLGAAGELSGSRWEPVESGHNFCPARDTCLGKSG